MGFVHSLVPQLERGSTLFSWEVKTLCWPCLRSHASIFESLHFLPAGLLGSMFSLLQFLVSPVIGASSDIFGRKAVLLASMVSYKFCSTCVEAASPDYSCGYCMVVDSLPQL